LPVGNGKEKAAETREFQALLEPEYQEDVLAYMAEMEVRAVPAQMFASLRLTFFPALQELTMPSVELIDQQPELAWYMRPYLIDFLVEIHSQYRLRPETLYLAVNIADRYTAKRIVYKRHYQLVGCAALWIAAKFEDAKDRIPTVQDLCAMTCNAYDASAFIQVWPAEAIYRSLADSPPTDGGPRTFDAELAHWSPYYRSLASSFLYHRFEPARLREQDASYRTLPNGDHPFPSRLRCTQSL
jgi:hypothetical protein